VGNNSKNGTWTKFNSHQNVPYSQLQDRWRSGSQDPQGSSWPAWRNVGLFGGALAGAHLLGKARVGGRPMYDRFWGVLRGLEEYSPAQFLRTFQLGSFFSQFTSTAAAESFYSPDVFLKNEGLRTYMEALIGGGTKTAHRLMLEGATFRGGRLYWGASEEIALRHAGVILNPPFAKGVQTPAARWSAAYARSLGIKDYAATWRGPKLEKMFGLSVTEGERFAAHIIGGQSRLQHWWRMGSAWGTEWVGRFNRLLYDPVEMPIISQAVRGATKAVRKLSGGRLALKYGFGVKPAGGLSMLARLGLKWGLVAGAGLTLWNEIDRLTRQSEAFEGTLFEEGTTYGLASLWAKANISISGAAETLGLHSFREWQEEVAPGSTSLLKLAAFPAIGAIAGPAGMWGQRVFRTARGQIAGQSLEAAAQAAKIAGREFGEGWFGKLAKGVMEKVPLLRGTTPMKFAALLGAAAGTALVAPFIPGALVPSERPEELRAIYSGEKEVPIRKGRFWLPFGRSDVAGGRIQRYQPHIIARLRMRAKEKALWGEEADKLSEFEKLYLKEFTYHLENRDQYGYAFPISSLPFEDVPLVGPLLAHTLGKWIKPPRLLRTEEWVRERGGGVEYAPEPLGYGEEYHPELGEIPRGAPASPYDLKSLIREQTYRMTEAFGLSGFVATAIKEKLTGTQEFFAERTELESFRRAHGAKRSYWEQEIGDPGFTEFFRRLYPHRVRSVNFYNPLESGAPSWLPGAGERSPNFQHGAVYAKVPLGELRLPGPGYEARYPELEGVAPENYPLVHQHKILADVARYSNKFREISHKVRRARKTEDWGEHEERIYQQTLEQLRARRERREFHEYQHLEPYGSQEDYKTFESTVLAEINRSKAAGEKEEGVVNSIFGGYWEWLSHSAETSAEQLTPFAPVSKLLHMRDAIEDYKQSQWLSNEYAFWQNPVENFLAPFATSTAHAFGADATPSRTNLVRSVEEYFDTLKYIKYRRLAMEAQVSGDMEKAKEYSQKQKETLFGMDPYTRNARAIYRALPRRERDYYQSFVNVETPGERAKILKMIPRNEKGFYLAQWQLRYADKLQKAVKEGVITGELADMATRQVDMVMAQRKHEGMPSNQELFHEYLGSRHKGESYPEWYRRTKLLPRKLAGMGLPGPDFVGFHPSVDLEDVKLKLVQNMAENIHNFDLWDDRARGLKYKPYINDGIVEDLVSPQLEEGEIRTRLDNIFGKYNIRGGQYHMNEINSTSGRNSVNINVRHRRDREVKRRIREQLSGF